MKRLMLAVITLLTLCLSSVAARADAVTLTLTNPTQDVLYSGGTLMFEATVTNSGGAEVFLNGDSFSVAGLLNLDDTDFLFNFPLSLAAGESFTGNLFTLTVPSSAMNSQFDGFFSIVGGADGGVQDVLATVNFTVNTIPEPASVFLVAAAMVAGMVRPRKVLAGRRAMLQA